MHITAAIPPPPAMQRRALYLQGCRVSAADGWLSEALTPDTPPSTSSLQSSQDGRSAPCRRHPATPSTADAKCTWRATNLRRQLRCAQNFSQKQRMSMHPPRTGAWRLLELGMEICNVPISLSSGVIGRASQPIDLIDSYQFQCLTAGRPARPPALLSSGYLL